MLKKILKYLSVTILFIFPILGEQVCNAQFSINIEDARVKTTVRESRVLGDFESTAKFSKFGGNLNKQVEETGFFNTKQVDGIWYIVDPEGYLFYSTGINSVVKGGGFVLPDSLQNINCNTMGCWSDESINSSANKIPYTPRWNLMLGYKNTTQRTKDLYNNGIIPVFDSAFETFCNQIASTSIAPLKNDPYILGHFSDNELPIYDNTTYGYLLDRFLKISSKTDANYLAAHNWMLSRKGENYFISATDREEFHGYVMGTYYRIVNSVLKKYDPNHLYLGSRLHGGAKDKPSIFREAGKYVDIISINVYSVWTPQKETMDMWASESGKPFLVTEFYAKAEDSGMANTDGAGWLVKTQADRARFFENFTLALLSHPGSVGFHYFKYIDKEGLNCGLVTLDFQWYHPMKNSFYKISKDVYRLRDFMINGYVDEGVATIFTDINFGKQARLLSPGNYSADDLEFMEIEGFEISSLKVKPGFRVKLYAGNLFNGDSVTVDSNISDLKEIDFAGKTKSLKIIPLSTVAKGDIRKDSRFAIYPNPCGSSLFMDFNGPSEEIKISLLTTAGTLVQSYNINKSKYSINTSNLPEGIYLIKADGKNWMEIKKIIRIN